jgi:SPP1 gp7 family putative phage head morphogenesis protein
VSIIVADSINMQISDRLIERQLQVGRVETGLRREVFAQLAVLESEILSSLKSHDPTQWALLARRRLEVQRLMVEELDPLVSERYQHIADLLDAALLRLARNEAETVERIVNDTTDTQTIDEQPSDRQLRAGVVRGIFPSPATSIEFATFGADWWKRQGQSLAQRLGDSLTVGVSLAESLTGLARRVRGSSEQGFQDGVMAKARDDAARLVRTQTTNAVGEARVAVAERNARQIRGVQHSSVLDAHTSYQCIARHGLQYTVPDHASIGHSIPYLNGPPYHPNCRSSMIPIIIGGGAVPQESLGAWLRRRGATFQDDVLGPTRAQMFRDGTLGSVRNLIDAVTGKPLTLEELGA